MSLCSGWFVVVGGVRASGRGWDRGVGWLPVLISESGVLRWVAPLLGVAGILLFILFGLSCRTPLWLVWLVASPSWTADHCYRSFGVSESWNRVSQARINCPVSMLSAGAWIPAVVGQPQASVRRTEIRRGLLRDDVINTDCSKSSGSQEYYKPNQSSFGLLIEFDEE